MPTAESLLRPDVARLRVKIFADGADLRRHASRCAAKPLIAGLDDQPDPDAQGRRHRLPRVRPRGAAGDPRQADQLRGVQPTTSPRWSGQANEIAGWGENVYVKIPVTNTAASRPRRWSAGWPGPASSRTSPPWRRSPRSARCRRPWPAARRRTSRVFAGRIADTGRDPVPMMAAARRDPRAPPHPGADLGQPARAPEHLPGRRDRLPRHHRHPRPAEEARPRRQGPGRVLARNRQNVP